MRWPTWALAVILLAAVGQVIVAAREAHAHDPGEFEYDILAGVQTRTDDDRDPYVYLLSRDGTVIADDDDSGSVVTVDETTGKTLQLTTKDSRIEKQPLAAGSYTIEATTYDAGAEGRFVLSIVVDSESPDPPAAKAPSQGCSENLGVLPSGTSRYWGRWDASCSSTQRSGRYARSYSFSLAHPATLTIELTLRPEPKANPIPLSLNCGWHPTCAYDQPRGNGLDFGGTDPVVPLSRTPVYAIFDRLTGSPSLEISFADESARRTCKTVRATVTDLGASGARVAVFEWIHVARPTPLVSSSGSVQISGTTPAVDAVCSTRPRCRSRSSP